MSLKTIVMSIKISPEEKDRIEDYAVMNDLTMSQVIRKALKFFFEFGE